MESKYCIFHSDLGEKEVGKEVEFVSLYKIMDKLWWQKRVVGDPKVSSFASQIRISASMKSDHRSVVR